MKIVEQEKEIGIEEGCNYRKDIQKKNYKLKSKQDKLMIEWNKIQEQINENLKLDKKLEEEGFCLQDKEKIIPNPLTGKIMKKEMVHQDWCISKGE